MDSPESGLPEFTPAINVEPTRPPVAPRAAESRLGIVHLLLIMGCVGAYLALVRGVAGRAGAVGTGLVLAQSLAVGAAWAGLLIFIARMVRGLRWSIQPGEWLLAIWGFWFALDAIITLGLRDSVRSSDLALAAITSCLLLAPAISPRQSRIWQVFFWLLIGLYAAPLAVHVARAWLDLPIPNAVSQLGHFLVHRRTLLVAVLVLVWAILDRRSARQRTWLHWLGLAVPLWLVCIMALEWLTNE